MRTACSPWTMKRVAEHCQRVQCAAGFLRFRAAISPDFIEIKNGKSPNFKKKRKLTYSIGQIECHRSTLLGALGHVTLWTRQVDVPAAASAAFHVDHDAGAAAASGRAAAAATTFQATETIAASGGDQLMSVRRRSLQRCRLDAQRLRK